MPASPTFPSESLLNKLSITEVSLVSPLAKYKKIGMFRMVTNRKNQARALVDIKKSVGPIPICFAISEVSCLQHLPIGRNPRVSNKPKWSSFG